MTIARCIHVRWLAACRLGRTGKVLRALLPRAQFRGQSAEIYRETGESSIELMHETRSLSLRRRHYHSTMPLVLELPVMGAEARAPEIAIEFHAEKAKKLRK